MFVIRLGWWASLFLVGAGSSAKVEFVSVPDVAATGESFKLTVRYELPPGKRRQLNVELKNAGNVVLGAARAQVSGKGEYEATLTAPADPQPIRIAAWIGTNWREPLSPMPHTKTIEVLPVERVARQRARLEACRSAAKSFHQRIGPRRGGKYCVGLLKDSLPDHSPALADELAVLVRRQGHEFHLVDANLVSNPSAITADRFDLLVLPSSGSVPVESVSVIHDFLADGGDLLALGAPAMVKPVWKTAGQWLSKEEWRKRLAEQPAEHMLFDFDKDEQHAWKRNTNTPDHPFAFDFAPGPNGKALHVRIEKMAGWDGLYSEALVSPFPDGHCLTCFYARGYGQTQSLSLEWQEKDGSRWIGVFPLTDQWKRYALTPHDFKFWESVPHRGRAGDCFKPENAVRLQIEVAWTHTGPRGGEYEFAIDQIGTASNPYGEVPAAMMEAPPRIEGLCPGYKFYPLSDVAALRPRCSFGGPPASIPLLSEMLAHHPRPTGAGFKKGRTWRWVPLLEAVGPKGQWRGAPAALYVDFGGPTKSSVRAAISVEDVRWYRQPAVQKLIAGCVERMARGVFIHDAGSEFYTYRPDQPVLLGARIANLSRTRADDLKVRYELTPAGRTKPCMTVNRPVNLPAGRDETLTHSIHLPKDSDEFRLTVRLLQGNREIDRVAHEVAVFRPKPREKRKFVTVREGDFRLEGKKWYVHGVNYMPSTGIGIEDWAYFERWLGARSYDPEFVQRDLERCREMGLNSVSIFVYHQSLAANNLIDILRRCEKLGLKVNLSIRPGTPMGYKWAWWEEVVRHDRLWEIDTIYAYDIAWEPFFGTEAQRRQYDAQWRAWIEKKYGSVAAAETAWSVPAPRHEGKVSTPSAGQLGNDGPHRKLVADYRRFADQLVHEKYKAAADQYRAIDPNHLVSFRMTVTGDPTFDGRNNMPYDFPGVADAMDFLAPEGYGRIGDWDRVKGGLFTVSYARYCAPDKPVLWAEAGVSTWNNQTMRPDPFRLAFQGSYFADFYKMVLASCSSGVVWWWYPGGFRANENSDFGIVNPDGTDRPATKTIRRFAARVLAERAIRKPDVWIAIDRDADARGLFGVYDRVKEAYWKAIEAGQTPGLRGKDAR